MTLSWGEREREIAKIIWFFGSVHIWFLRFGKQNIFHWNAINNLHIEISIVSGMFRTERNQNSHRTAPHHTTLNQTIPIQTKAYQTEPSQSIAFCAFEEQADQAGGKFALKSQSQIFIGKTIHTHTHSRCDYLMPVLNHHAQNQLEKIQITAHSMWLLLHAANPWNPLKNNSTWNKINTITIFV